MVIISRHQVFSLLFLVASFIFASCLLFILECEFIALLFVVIYVGAIAVLFLFSVMMLESKITDLSKNALLYFPIGAVFGLFFTWTFIDKILIVSDDNVFKNEFYYNVHKNWYESIDLKPGIEVYGQVIYSYFVLELLVSGLILLAIIVGVVFLTNDFTKKHSKHQSLFKQLSRRSQIFSE
jgi:NADH-quinone oxidoreductase subunit J